MCCQQFTVSKRKGKKNNNGGQATWLVATSCGVVVLVALFHASCAQQESLQESVESIKGKKQEIIMPPKRNKPPILPCGDERTLHGGDEYFIQSPGFPKMKYGPLENCKWKFTADNCNMGINCPDFQLSEFLCFDHLDIVERNGTMNRYCGNRGPNETSLVEQVSITFSSSAWWPDIGFRCRVVCRDSEAQSPFPKLSVNDTTCFCGKAEKRVTNGENADITHFPWQGGLVRKGGTAPFCGGTLINSKYVLTAAHCVQGRTPYNLEIIFNVTDFGDTGGPQMEVRRTVDNILRHKNFTSRLDYDAALVRLSEPIDISGETKMYILPVCLPTEEDLTKMYVGRNATVTGWGLTSEEGEVSSTLQKAQVKVISNEECMEYYPTITDRMLCSHTPGKDACQGDSGGPLLVAEGEIDGHAMPFEISGKALLRYVQVGIVSWGQGCGVRPGVYTRVTELVNWIATNARDGSYCGIA